MLRFLFFLVLAAAAIATVTYAGHSLGLFETPSFSTVSIVFLALCTACIYYLLDRAAVKSLFVHLYLATMVAKLLIYGAYLFIIVLNDRREATGNVVIFLITYFIFTLLEVGFLYRRMTGNKGA